MRGYSEGRDLGHRLQALSFGAAGGRASVSVSTQDGCSWSAVSNQAWAWLSPTTGAGSGSTLLTVEANAASAARTAEIVIAGRSFTIVQDGTSGSGPVNTSVKSKTSKPGKPATIRGSGFDPSKSGNSVYFGTKPAKLKRASANRLTVTIPKGVRCTVDVFVRVGGRESNHVSFVVK